jgi:uncharacterized cysteine cluster protein YcgN (CxxCxxCC family)
MTEEPFWRRKKLTEMTEAEWESLCDGCGKCCLVKLQDEDTDEILHTDVACHLLDQHSCRCTRYRERHELVPDCVKVTAENIAELAFMPRSCAYRRLAEGKDLSWWHPLVSGRRDTVHKAGVSVRYRVISEAEVDDEDLPDHIVDWSR